MWPQAGDVTHSNGCLSLTPVGPRTPSPIVDELYRPKSLRGAISVYINYKLFSLIHVCKRVIECDSVIYRIIQD